MLNRPDHLSSSALLRSTYESEMECRDPMLKMDYSDWLRVTCDLELINAGLSWKHPRVKRFLDQCSGRQGTLLADVTDEVLESLVCKLKVLPTNPEVRHG